jgi:hypothetical protein
VTNALCHEPFLFHFPYKKAERLNLCALMRKNQQTREKCTLVLVAIRVTVMQLLEFSKRRHSSRVARTAGVALATTFCAAKLNLCAPHAGEEGFL